MYLCNAIPKGCPTEWAENILYEPDPGNAGEGKLNPATLFWNAIGNAAFYAAQNPGNLNGMDTNRETLFTVGLS